MYMLLRRCLAPPRSRSYPHSCDIGRRKLFRHECDLSLHIHIYCLNIVPLVPHHALQRPAAALRPRWPRPLLYPRPPYPFPPLAPNPSLPLIYQLSLIPAAPRQAPCDAGLLPASEKRLVQMYT